MIIMNELVNLKVGEIRKFNPTNRNMTKSWFACEYLLDKGIELVIDCNQNDGIIVKRTR